MRAGYSPRTAEAQASRLLRNVKVRAAVGARLEKHLRKVDLRAEDVLRAIERHVKADGRADARDYFDAVGNLKAIHDLSAGFLIHEGNRFVQNLGLVITNLTDELYSEFSNASFFRPQPERRIAFSYRIRGK